MRLATVFDVEANEPRPVFELPGGQRVELRELFSPVAPVMETLELDERDLLTDDLPLYFTDISKTVEYLEDVIDAVRQWSRERSEQAERLGGSAPDREAEQHLARVNAMPFLPPVPNVRALREFDAFEANARAWHAAHGLDLPESWSQTPSLAFGNTSSLIGHGAHVSVPRASDELDFGLHLAAIVGRGGRDIAVTDAWKHVAGFAIVNAFVARDVERAEVAARQARAKSRDFATAVGPYLVSLNSLSDRIDADGRLHLAMRAIVNGQEVSRGDAASMAFTWPQLIEHASRDADLRPGDLITSGTIGGGSLLTRPGAASSMDIRWLNAGDVVELEVERLGVLRTPVVERPSNGTGVPAGGSSRRATLAV